MTLSFSMTQFGVLAGFGSVVLGMLMAFLSLFLIMLILLQRGRGGGLSGALGGAGGQSAFGSKAGDTFTVLTVSLAGVWIVVCAFAMWSLGMHVPKLADSDDAALTQGPGSDADNIANDLVIPTTSDQPTEGNDGGASQTPAGESDGPEDGDTELAPAEVSSEAGFESPAEMSEPETTTAQPAAQSPVE